MTLEITTNRYGARPVMTHQAGAVPGFLSRRSPSNATRRTFVSSCGVRGRTRRATGRKNTKPKLKEQSVINIMHWNAEGVSNKRDELQHFLHENNVNICCIAETHLQEGNLLKSEDTKFSGVKKKERKKERRCLVLIRNNINAREIKTYMEEAEYFEIKVTIGQSSYKIVKKLLLSK
ncbi:unnamed protein product [Mytilus coruscus]|uniref:Endonuclease/exonuclease/phosphatase domain-containing protein n=1 Tax=Mytilus coruscus TaxID=42192 RepID=A0A6J8D6N0_MYTCO|nr:unnamed protein product [Mytilus coruscus]